MDRPRSVFDGIGVQNTDCFRVPPGHYVKERSGEGCAAAKPSTPFDTIGEALSFANDLASRLEDVTGRLLGSVPETKGIGNATVASDGDLPGLASRAEYTRGRLGDAMAALSRIERALP